MFLARVLQFTDRNNRAVNGVVTFRSSNERFIRCDVCQKYPEIVKRYVPKRPPPITTATGTHYRADVLEDHIKTAYHIECSKAKRISSLNIEEQECAPMDIAVSRANIKMVNYVSKLMIQVFNDGKRLNLSAWSWPSRFVAGETSYSFESRPENQMKSIISNGLNLQYVNPPGHLELMTAIVSSHRQEFLKKIENCRTISLRVDGSVDLNQIDKIYVMGKLINLDGTLELVFLGIGEQKERFATGLMAAVDEALKIAVSEPNIIYRKLSSVCTDGANINIGEKQSLWTLLEAKCKSAGSNIPLIKIWCGAHRAELAWKDTAKSVGEVRKVLSTLSQISSHFHTSSLRSGELKEIASSDPSFKLLSIPKLFEVRWSQFSFQLLRSVLVSWQPLVIYFERNAEDSACAGFHNYLTNSRNLQLIAFLADVLFSYSRFQQKLQGDRLTIISMKQHVAAIINALIKMDDSPLPGGFEEKFTNSLITNEDGKMFLKGVELLPPRPRRRGRELESIHQLRNKVLNSLKDFLTKRFDAEEKLLRVAEPFVNFDKDTNLNEIHSLLAPDLSLSSLYLQFEDIANSNRANNIRDSGLNGSIVQLSKNEESRAQFKELIDVLARINACTPHSSDVERCISANNILKTSNRASIHVETENKYIYIHTNMPDLAEWNPTPAAVLFVNEKARRHRDITPEMGKARHQPYFKGIFPGAEGDDTDENENISNEQALEMPPGNNF